MIIHRMNWSDHWSWRLMFIAIQMIIDHFTCIWTTNSEMLGFINDHFWSLCISWPLIQTKEDCQILCDITPGCNFYNFDKQQFFCFLKYGVGDRKYKLDVEMGYKSKGIPILLQCNVKIDVDVSKSTLHQLKMDIT